MLTFVGEGPEKPQLPLYQAHIDSLLPGVTAARHDCSDWRCVKTSLRSPAVQLPTSTRAATEPECASFVRPQLAALFATLAPACWKQTGSVEDELVARSVSRDGFC